MKRRKVWLGLGAAILVTPHAAAIAEAPLPLPARVVAASTMPDEAPITVAQHAHAPKAKGSGGEGGERGMRAAKAKPGGEAGEGGERGTRAMKAKPGGEAGEGGEGGGGNDASLEPSLRFSRDLQLIRGHLLVGDELVQAGRWKEALPHFLHPGEEIYAKITADLKKRNLPPFATALKALAQTVKAKNKDAYARALTTLEERLADADKALRSEQANWPYFTMETTLETLRSAADEYGEAIEGGRISNVVEYQDARGFVWEAERLFAAVADELAKKDGDAVSAIRTAFADLKSAWPSAMPPQKPMKDLGQVLSDISKIELQLSRFR
jgi:hypothetical protein